MSKFTREDLKNWFRDIHRDEQDIQVESKDGLLTESYGDGNDPMSHKPYASSGTFSSAGSEARHSARRREESPPVASGRTIYALINIPYEPSIVVSENSMEALRGEISEWVDNPLGASVEAIFYADIIEGEL